MPPRKKQTKPKTEKTPTADTKPTNARGKKRKITDADSISVKKEKVKVKQELESSCADEKGELKKMKFTGTVPVDEECVECLEDYHVHIEPGGKGVYNAMLNQTNIGSNNNKYYILQILKHNAKPEYVTWFRWGRVGKTAGTSLKRYGVSFFAALKEFDKKYTDKTGNIFNFVNVFTKIKGKYDLVEMDYGENTEAEKKKVKEMIKKGKKNKKQVESKLDKRVQDVIDLIFDVKEFEACVKELEFDVKKAPLGKLTTKQIKAGYESLRRIEDCIRKKDFGGELSDACSEFYTRIPHDFGMKPPSLIKTDVELKQKIQLLESLSDIQIALQMIEKDDEKPDDMNIKDHHYYALGCKLEPLEKRDAEYKMVQKYVTNTKDTSKLTVENVYKVEREGEEKRFMRSMGNRMLLWHGSGLPNWCGILKQGLRIAPPEAPSSGCSYGKGVYFADMLAKSACFCCASKSRPYGFLLLCEVALGNINEKDYSNFSGFKLPKGKHSTKALGSEEPDPKSSHTMECGTLGKPQPVKGREDYMEYNEFVVYDVAQIKARYLIKAKFQCPWW